MVHNTEKQWEPYEDASVWSVDRIRHTIFPTFVSKRHFFLPRINLVGITIPEILIAIAGIVALVFLGMIQRTAEAEESGNIAQFLWTPMFLLICYRSIPGWIFGISFERSMFWHGYFALLATAYGIWHGISAMYWEELDDDNRGRKSIRGWNAFRFGEDRFEFITGAVISGIMILILVTSIHPIRRVVRRFWLWSHHILPLAAVVFCLLHGAAGVLIGLGIYVADRVFGYTFQAWFQYRAMGSQSKATVLPSGIVKLSFPRSISFMPGQYMGIQIPSISVFEFHTFSIATSPSDDELVFLIQPNGIWSRRLAKKVALWTKDSDKPVEMRTFLHGPIGSVSLDWQSKQYNTFVLVAGGIGITPMMSIYRHLAQQKLRGRKLNIVKLIWSLRSRQLLTDCVTSHNVARSTSDIWNGESDTEHGLGRAAPGFEAQIYLTRDAPVGIDYPHCMESQSPESRALGLVTLHDRRPDLRQILENVRNTVAEDDSSRVAVLACGPGALTADVCNKARVVSCSRAHFDVHLEHFY